MFWLENKKERFNISCHFFNKIGDVSKVKELVAPYSTVKIRLQVRNSYLALGLQFILEKYFEQKKISVMLIDSSDNEQSGHILFYDAPTYYPQASCGLNSNYQWIFIVENTSIRSKKKVCSCGCEDALFKSNSQPNMVIQYLRQLMSAEVPKKKSRCSLSTLSARERQVLSYIKQGVKPKKISQILFISPKTLSAHKMNAMRKLKIDNAIGLFYWLKENGSKL